MNRWIGGGGGDVINNDGYAQGSPCVDDIIVGCWRNNLTMMT